MKFIYLFIVILSFELSADHVKKTIAVCAQEKDVDELVEYVQTHSLEKGGLDAELWLMQHECKIIDKNTPIKVMNYTGKKQRVLKILLKNTGDIVYAPNKGVEIEQPGQKNVIYKF